MKKILSLLVICFVCHVDISAQSVDLKEYTGIYVFPDGSVVPSVEVTLTDTVLTMSSEAGSSVITREGQDTFFIVEFNGIAIFKRDSTNKVNAVHIEAGGYILDGKKQENNGSIARRVLLNKSFALLRKENA